MTLSRSIVTAAAAALSVVQLTHAWNIELPPCLSKFQAFVSSGCFQDGGPGNPSTLIFRSSLPADNMTVEECVAECKGNGFRYAGLEYYGVCFCGGTVNGPQVDDSQCTFPCNGNKTEICGGDNLLSVWQDPTFPTNNVTIGDYKASGCYTDNSSIGRTLSWAADVNSSTLTTENCLSACENEGFPIAGTEFGGECWCGNVLANYTSKVDDSQCNFPCNGNSTETCGGSGLLTLYIAQDLESLQPCSYEPPASSSTTLVSTTSTSTSTIPSATSTTEAPSTTSSTTEAPPPSTTTTPTTTTTKAHTTTTTSSLCTATVTTPPVCDYKCGNWCFHPLPDWNNEKDCLKAYATCAASVAACFSQAGYPGALQCFNFGLWCSNIEKYCSSTCKYGKCSKGDCWNHYPGQNGSPPKTSTTLVPCSATTTTKPATTTKSSSCPPTPTNICTQPSNPKYGYGPGNPVGGIALPILSCNDIYDDWRNNPFKLYIDQDSRKCPSYPPKGCGNACSDACKEQYEQCTDVYQKGCQDGSNGSRKRGENRKRLLSVSQFTQNWGTGSNSPANAARKCQAQYQDCLSVNKNVDPKQKCKTWGC